jgi:hypothetical protein
MKKLRVFLMLTVLAMFGMLTFQPTGLADEDQAADDEVVKVVVEEGEAAE